MTETTPMVNARTTGKARPVDEFDRRLLDKLHRDLGPVLTAVLSDPKTVELMLNPDGRLWLEQLGAPMRCIGRMERAAAESVLRTLAGHLGQEITAAQPLLEGELPGSGARFAGQLPPVVANPAFCVRKPAISRLVLGHYVEQRALSLPHLEVLQRAVRQHRNILVVGGTGSGKTTFVNALIAEMTASDATERLVILEDTREIQCDAQNVVQYRACAEVSMTQLLRASLRMRPDRIVVGEVRGPEALDLLMAWNTGHQGGAATVHANDARAGLMRLSMLASMHPDAPGMLEVLVAEAVDLVVFVTRTPGGRRVQEVIEVCGHGAAGYQTQPL